MESQNADNKPEANGTFFRGLARVQAVIRAGVVAVDNRQ
jgi:hypothetical protein